MKNETLFRGTRLEDGKSVVGFLFVGIPETYDSYIIPQEVHNGHEQELHGDWNLVFPKYDQVVPESVVRSVGLLGKNGVEIFEGDQFLDDDGDLCTITWDEAFLQWYADYNADNGLPLHRYDIDEIEIIGNVHDKIDFP